MLTLGPRPLGPIGPIFFLKHLFIIDFNIYFLIELPIVLPIVLPIGLPIGLLPIGLPLWDRLGLKCYLAWGGTWVVGGGKG